MYRQRRLLAELGKIFGLWWMRRRASLFRALQGEARQSKRGSLKKTREDEKDKADRGAEAGNGLVTGKKHKERGGNQNQRTRKKKVK